MTTEERAAVRPLVEAYEEVRRAEKWGGDDLDLPFHPLRHHDIWTIRQRTFQAFEALIAGFTPGLALDIGAGNCWMTRYLDQWGFDAIAIDTNESAVDGLQAGQKYINGGARFLRVLSAMERLPFRSDEIRLIATNASFHYAVDFRAALAEFTRVLTPGGVIAIVDSPFYQRAEDGERMLAERVVEFQRKYEMPEALARRSRYLTYRDLEEFAASMNLACTFNSVWPGIRRSYEEMRAWITGRKLAKFPVVLLKKQ